MSAELTSVRSLDDDDEGAEHDQRVYLSAVTWKGYEALLAVRGDRPRPRVYYLDGIVELMTTSLGHEFTKKMLARLLEAWTDEHEIEFNGYGSATFKRSSKKAGAEPDECFEAWRS